MADRDTEVWDAVREVLSGTHRAAPIESTARDEDPPPSYAQEGIWLHEQLHPKGGAFNTTLAIQIDGPLDVASLSSALGAIVRRHEVLRTSIIAVNGIPRQRVSREVAIQLRQSDLSQLTAEQHMVEIGRLALAKNMVPFDLSQPPLWRLELVRLAARSHVLLLTVHHIVWDQSSFSVWLGELADLYPDAGPTAATTLPELAVQHADFAHWERREVDSDRLHPQIEYWRTKLEGSAWHVELPQDRPRPQVPTFAGRSCWIRFDDSLRAGLGELSRGVGTTLFMTMLAGFSALLARYGNTSEVVVGAPFSKRYRTELRPLIGPLINLLMLRLDVSGDPTVGELLERVRTAVTEAYPNQDAPYEKVTATMRPDQERSGGPRVQTMFTFYRMPPRRPSRARWSCGPSTWTTARHGWTWSCTHGKPRMDCTPGSSSMPTSSTPRPWTESPSTMSTCSPAWLRTPAAGYLSSRYSARTNGDSSWRNGAASRAQAYPTARSTSCSRRKQDERRRRQRLSRPADVLSYAELDERANRLAGHLHLRGIGAGSLVAVHLEREPSLIVALLAILKVGAAYVPLDVADPPERSMLILADSGAELLLTTATRRALLRDSGVDVLVLDELLTSPGGERPLPVGSSHIAYVTYTSGSTGTPKGIVVPHGAVLDSVIDTDYLTLAPGDRIAQAANISFDVATVEIWVRCSTAPPS